MNSYNTVKEKITMIFSILLDGKIMSDLHQIETLYIRKEINKIAYAKCTILETGAYGMNFEASDSGDFLPGKKIEIRLGYETNTNCVFKGIITSHGLH